MSDLQAKTDNQMIAYIEDTEVFDLKGNERCTYNPVTGNLVELAAHSIFVSTFSIFLSDSFPERTEEMSKWG
jgi:hypothetical protein